MRVTLDLLGFTKEVDIDMYSYNRGIVEMRILPELYTLLCAEADEPVKKPRDIIVRFRHCGGSTYKYESTLLNAGG